MVGTQQTGALDASASPGADARRPLLALGGPTASGKTALALALAARLDGEIVNADSRQVYIGMDIGTAKPALEQRGAIPHHLFDLASPDEDFTLAQYTRHARAAIAAIHARGKLPIVVGGTGLYLRALVEGYQVPEVAPDARLRAELEDLARVGGPEALVARLRALDPVGAELIDQRNPRRLIRALEVSLTLGLPFSALQRCAAPYRSRMLVLEGENALLYERADRRLREMFEGGFVAEVAALVAAGHDFGRPAFTAHGYRETARMLRGEWDREAALAATRTQIHSYIRRQHTWFRADKTASRVAFDDPRLLDHTMDLARELCAPTAP